MNLLIVFLLLLVNFGISWFNAWSAGRFWTEVKIMGGWSRFLVWCAVIMSACGFTWVILTVLTVVTIAGGYLTPEMGEAMFGLGYLIIIGPVIGSGMGIWVHSLIQAYKTRRFGDIAVAGWNTFAQVHNVYEAARNAPGIFEMVISRLGKGSKDSKQAAIVILLVILALGGGIMITAAIVRKADRDYVEDFVTVSKSRA